MVVLVPTRAGGLTIFPTHRHRRARQRRRRTPDRREPGDELPGARRSTATATTCSLEHGDGLDVEVVERLAPRGRDVHAGARRGGRGGRPRRRRGGVPAAPDGDRAGAGRSRAAARRCRRRRRTSIPSSPRACSSIRLTDWLALCRAAVEDVQGVLAELPTRAEREPVVGAGKGGDDTTAIDAAAERVDPRALRRARRRSRSSPRRSGVDRRAARRRRRRPDRRLAEREARHPVLLALDRRRRQAPTMDDVHFGYVYDFGTRRGVDGRARRGRAPRTASRSTATGRRTRSRSSRSRRRARPRSPRRRRRSSASPIACGSWARWRSRSAISPPAASTRVCSLKPARAVDIAAAQLLVRERGFAIDLPEAPPFAAAPLDLEGRSRVVAAGTPELCGQSRSRPVRIGCSGWNYARWKDEFYEGHARASCGSSTTRGIRHGRGQQHLLPPAARDVGRPLGRGDAAGLRLRGQGEPLPDAHQAADGSRRGLRRFYERIEPLRRSPKLGPVLWQLPANFRRDDERLAAALARLPPGRHCFEFRHASWFVEPVYELLREHGAALVIGDRPEARFQSHELTTDWTFIRFHYGSRGRAVTTASASWTSGRDGSRAGAVRSRCSPTSTTTGKYSPCGMPYG